MRLWPLVIFVVLLFNHIEFIECYNKPTLSSTRRSVLFVNNLTVESFDRNISISLLPGTGSQFNWNVYKNGFNILENERIKSLIGQDSFLMNCVTTYDSGVYHFRQKDSLNTGYNIETTKFNLNVIGNDTETLVLERSPSTIVISGSAFPIQPVVGFGRNLNLPDWVGESKGRIEPIILSSPSNGQNSHYLLQFQSPIINFKKKTVTFTSLALLGEKGTYKIGFIDMDTCEMHKMQVEILVVGVHMTVVFETVISLFIVWLVIVISYVIDIISKYKMGGKGFLPWKLAILTPMESIYKYKGEGIRFYFKSQRILVFMIVFFTSISVILFVPVTMQGDNKFRDIYLLSQPNWNASSTYLFLYQVEVALYFVAMIIVYTRFNDERIYLSYDSNHLVTSRTVLLTGLPKSLINVQLLKDFLQTGYSNGIYAASIVLVKIFSQQDKENDVNGRLEKIYVDPNNDINQLPPDQVLHSTGKAFITFSCVSDAHLFINQFSPYKWTKALIKRITKPHIPEEYRIELSTDKWKAYSAPRVSDILWTKLHNPANFRHVGITIIQFVGTIFSFLLLVCLCVFYIETQFSIIPGFTPVTINTHSNALYALGSTVIYYFIPSILLLFLNNSIPSAIRYILLKSNSYVRSFSKSKGMFLTFVFQSVLVVIYPSFYFLVNNDNDHGLGANSFITPINFFRRGGLFYFHFMIIFSIVTPFLELTNLFDIVKKFLIHRKSLKAEDILNFEPVDLKKQYLNSLLVVMILGCYGPIFPIIFVYGLFYLIVKFFLVKYVCIASKAPIPQSDRYFIVSFQKCIWFIILMVTSFHFYYIQTIRRFDLLFVYAFLVLIACGKYIPTCSKSLCYSVFDGAVFPCFGKDNNSSDDDEDDNEGDSDAEYYDQTTSEEEEDDNDDEEYYEDNSDEEEKYFMNNNNNSNNYGGIELKERNSNNNNSNKYFNLGSNFNIGNSQNHHNKNNQSKNQNNNVFTNNFQGETDLQIPKEYYYDEDLEEYIEKPHNPFKRHRSNNIIPAPSSPEMNKKISSPTILSTNNNEINNNDQINSESDNININNSNNNNINISESGEMNEEIQEYLKDPEDNVVELKQRKFKIKEKILKIKQSYTSGKGGFLSKFFRNRYKLPTPESMTVTTYVSPYFSMDVSQCENVKDIESDDYDDDDEEYEYEEDNEEGPLYYQEHESDPDIEGEEYYNKQYSNYY